MRFSFTDDIALIKSLKKGDPEAYTFLVKNYHHKLCVYAYSLTSDNDQSEDIVQNVFVKIWRKRSKLKDDFSVKSYLYKMIYNEFIDQYRKQKITLVLEKKHIDALSSIVEEKDEKSLERLIAIVKQEIENLPPKCKKTFLLSKEEGLSNIEISEYLDVSIKTVEAHISKAFALLRKAVGHKINGVLFLLFDRHIKTE
ncbi:RNA polymerase sigma factor [Aestuariivivens insulae]|uniref:RNA polymerase sigma factor n=1 Tax=Aestuariivivens insulae TaxID=1621988 RepID=UPI001F59D6EB|nr:RNA polymerase sigma-70 factor [Aestuariivivens insulae]